MTVAVHWFRNGLRLHDNPALIEAHNNAEKLLTLYIFDETTFSKYSYTRKCEIRYITYDIYVHAKSMNI